MPPSSSSTAPAFVAFTGMDDASQLPAMRELSARYPIEWGVLIDPQREGQPSFPAVREVEAIRRSGLRLAAHVCGTLAQSIATTGEAPVDLGGFARAQINHGFAGSNEAQIAGCHCFGLRRGLRVVLQCQGDFPLDARVDWLFDASFGTGRPASHWPALRFELPFCGFSGGLGPQTVAAELQKIAAPGPFTYWIDMESGVRTDGRFDLAKCAQVCARIFDIDFRTTA